ncbi:MAG: O-methyltransferase [Planctomycetota bacterium]|jgi:predicted O-methyltransferase YrrM
MARRFEADDWNEYRMVFSEPHRVLEPLEDEIAAVDAALAALVDAGVLPHGRYDEGKFLAHRAAVKENFEIPWTGITPRMQRLLYAINAVSRPATMVGVGVFCGNTFISNAGAAIGPGACYAAERLVGIEIKPDEADRARRNVSKIDPDGRAEIVAADGVAWVAALDGTIDLLYLDADGAGGRGKAIYLDIVEAALHAMHPGALVLAHNSVNSAAKLADYFEHVRDDANFRESVNMVVDDQGLEVSVL